MNKLNYLEKRIDHLEKAICSIRDTINQIIFDLENCLTYMDSIIKEKEKERIKKGKQNEL